MRDATQVQQQAMWDACSAREYEKARGRDVARERRASPRGARPMTKRRERRRRRREHGGGRESTRGARSPARWTECHRGQMTKLGEMIPKESSNRVEAPGIVPEWTKSSLTGRSPRRTDDQAMELPQQLRGGGAGNRTRVREALNGPSFTCVVAVSPATELADSAATYLPLVSLALSGAPSREPALVANTLRIPGRSLLRMAQRFLGRESECIVVRTYTSRLMRRSRSRQHASTLSVPASKPIAPDAGRARMVFGARFVKGGVRERGMARAWQRVTSKRGVGAGRAPVHGPKSTP